MSVETPRAIGDPILALAAGDVLVPLDAWLRDEDGHSTLAGAKGWGLPPIEPQWSTGAGDGATWLHSRVGTRELTLPLAVFAPDAAGLRSYLSRLATVLAPDVAPASLRYVDETGMTWTLPVVRADGGDWSHGTETDGKTWLRTELTLHAGDPYWTRAEGSVQVIRPGKDGRGLLRHPGSLSMLRLSSGQALGSVEVDNPGDAPAWAIWTVTGPGENFVATSVDGQVLRWNGALAEGEVLTIDTQAGTVVDGTGANRYGELAPAPRFWPIRPGASTVSVVLEGANSEQSQIGLTWHPRRWSVI